MNFISFSRGVQELEAIKARVREMEEEAEKLKELQNEVEKQMNLSPPPGAFGSLAQLIQWRMNVIALFKAEPLLTWRAVEFCITLLKPISDPTKAGRRLPALFYGETECLLFLSFDGSSSYVVCFEYCRPNCNLWLTFPFCFVFLPPPPLPLTCSRPRHHVHRRKDGSRWQINLCRKCEYISNRRLIEQFPPISSLNESGVMMAHLEAIFSAKPLEFGTSIVTVGGTQFETLWLQDCGQRLLV